jgi:hypothetical protein
MAKHPVSVGVGRRALMARIKRVLARRYRPPRPVSQGLQPVLLVAVEDFVAGLARDAQLATDIRITPAPCVRCPTVLFTLVLSAVRYEPVI